jgi:hypothetical protein
MVIVAGLAALAAGVCFARTAQAEDLASHAPAVLARDAWKAKEALPGMKRHQPVSIVLHHTGEKQQRSVSLERKMQGLQNFSQMRAPFGPGRVKPIWGDVPYHFYIDVAGRIAEGRGVMFVGDTNTKYDPTGHIQIVLEGNFEVEMPARPQLDAVRDLVAWLTLAWNIPADKISTHGDHARTPCPGKNFMTGWTALRGEINAKRGTIVASLCATRPAADFAQLYCGAR